MSICKEWTLSLGTLVRKNVTERKKSAKYNNVKELRNVGYSNYRGFQAFLSLHVHKRNPKNEYYDFEELCLGSFVQHEIMAEHGWKKVRD
jgi:hypothetical protein